MFCPGCGQQQVPETMRFCSRCGLAISGITDWLARSEGSVSPRKTLRARLASARKEIRLAAKVMFFSIVLAPLFLGLSVMSDSPGPLYVPLLAFVLGSVLMLYSTLFGEGSTAGSSRQYEPPKVGTTHGDAALPPATSIGINDLAGQRPNTAEMAAPPSVTDRTTKLLERDEQQKSAPGE